MNKITRRLAALGLAATMVGSLAACGGNSSDTQTAAGAGPGSPASKPLCPYRP